LVYRFSRFEFDDARYELRRGGLAIELQPKVMQVLLYLVRNADRTCTKDELIEAVWADVSVSEASLVRCIAVARRALDESEGDARIIRTVRGRGYRIGVPVESGEESAPAATTGTSGGVAPARRRAPGPVVLASGALLLLLLWLGWMARPYAELPELRKAEARRELPATSVAVIPGVAGGPDAEIRGLAESVAIQTIDRLGKVAELRVVSHASSFGADTARLGAREIGQRLSAGTLVFERVDRERGVLRTTVEVVDAGSGFQRWSQSYQGGEDVALELGGEIAEDVIRVVGTLVHAGPDFVRGRGKVTPLAYYLLGRVAVERASRDRLLEAVDRYEQAIELDPGYVDAYVALANAYEKLWSYDGSGAGWLDRGEIAVLKARELDPEHSDALSAHATLLRARRDWDAAEKAYLRAIELGASAYTYNRYAAMLCMLGRTAEAEPLIERALELSPPDPEIQRTAGRVQHYLGNHRAAADLLLRALELDPKDADTPRVLASALDASGQKDKAREALLLLAPETLRPLLRIHGRLFPRESGLRLMVELDIARTGEECRGDGLGTAMAWAFIGDRERMLTCLAEAVDDYLWYAAVEPVFDPYRDDPRFQKLMRAAGFPARRP
jgi:DNA-binding winged helix-turn-helix (wHTH) protein/tetratricopeptide (TPR) repeat protein